jgi:dolichol kinase
MLPNLLTNNILWLNITITGLTFIYVFGLVAFINWCVTRSYLSAEISRKITHIGAGSLIAFLPLYNDTHLSKYLNVTILVVWMFLLIQKGFFASAEDEAVKTMTRNGDRKELLKGPLYFVIVAIICGIFFYKTFPGIVAIATLGWGDGIAPIIGYRYGKLKYQVFSNKSVEGTLSMFLFAFAANIFFLWLIIPHELNITRVLMITIIATVVEGCSPKEVDNLLVPLSVIIASNFI